MKLHEHTTAKVIAEKLAGPLSSLLCHPLVSDPTRAFDAYLNFLMGKGSGTGWDLAHEIEAALSMIKNERPVVFDVGANIGTWARILLQKSPCARVYMFEPSPMCHVSIDKLKLANATLIPKAVGESAGVTFLHTSSDDDGSASLHARGDSYFQHKNYHKLEVGITTVDAVIEENQIEFVDFMKMDIEGHEYFALKGACKALENRRIGALSFEFGSGNINSRTYFRDFWNLLSEAGFTISRVTPGGRLLPIRNYYEDLEYFRGVSNYIARLE